MQSTLGVSLANGESDPEGCSPPIQVAPGPAVLADCTVSIEGVLFDNWISMLR
ncbi:MAG: hypothetical protein ACXVKJ_07585 [Ilumatobacteraceae bacterium]